MDTNIIKESVDSLVGILNTWPSFVKAKNNLLNIIYDCQYLSRIQPPPHLIANTQFINLTREQFKAVEFSGELEFIETIPKAVIEILRPIQNQKISPMEKKSLKRMKILFIESIGVLCAEHRVALTRANQKQKRTDPQVFIDEFNLIAENLMAKNDTLKWSKLKGESFCN